MRINSSNVGMDSARSFTSATTRSSYFSSQKLTLKQGRLSANAGFANLMTGDEDESATTTDTQRNPIDFSQFNMRNALKSVGGVSKVASRDQMEAMDRIRQQCIQYLMQLFYPQRYHKNSASNQPIEQIEDGSANEQMASEADFTWNTFHMQETYYEEEMTSFQTTGSVVTADGRQIDFNLELEMSRSFQETHEITYQSLARNVEFCDPLVINLDQPMTQVSDQKFLFDIDADGVLDSISQLEAGSGYLALDKNDDGIINDGSELFGTKSGDGFGDLALYDEDGNGWIDEADSIWEKLMIWTKDENGKDQLYHLSEKGVGAICLKKASTNFSLNSLHDNQTNAAIRSTGIFLYENGNVGTMQHLDLAR